MIDISEDPTSGNLVLVYTPEADSGWISHKLKTDGNVTVAKTFTLTSEQVIRDEEDQGDFVFLLGTREGEYFRIRKDILNLKAGII